MRQAGEYGLAKESFRVIGSESDLFHLAVLTGDVPAVRSLVAHSKDPSLVAAGRAYADAPSPAPRMAATRPPPVEQRSRWALSQATAVEMLAPKSADREQRAGAGGRDGFGGRFGGSGRYGSGSGLDGTGGSGGGQTDAHVRGADRVGCATRTAAGSF